MTCRFQPYCENDAATNMALDLALIDEAAVHQVPVMRAYGWLYPAFTCGISQTRAEVLAAFPEAAAAEIVQRPTGGGIVDHRHSLTYAIAVPPTLPLYREPAPTLYRRLHGKLAEALQAQGFSVVLAPCTPCPPGGRRRQAACFTTPEPDDVMLPNGIKVAGAALRRMREGLLIQGTIATCPLPGLDAIRLFADLAACPLLRTTQSNLPSRLTR